MGQLLLLWEKLPVPIVVVVFTKLRTTRDNSTPHLPGRVKEYDQQRTKLKIMIFDLEFIIDQYDAMSLKFDLQETILPHTSLE